MRTKKMIFVAWIVAQFFVPGVFAAMQRSASASDIPRAAVSLFDRCSKETLGEEKRRDVLAWELCTAITAEKNIDLSIDGLWPDYFACSTHEDHRSLLSRLTAWLFGE